MGADRAEFEALCALLGEGGAGAERALSAFVLSEERFGERAYQPRPERFGDLQRALAARIAEGLGPRATEEDYPEWIFLISRCRTGTNAMLRLFGAAGLLSACQPFKNSLRHRLIGERYVWPFPPPGSHARIWAKTTFGPFTRAESLFDPVDALLTAGYPAAKIQLLFYDREPLGSLLSWHRAWGDMREAETLDQNFVLSSLNVRRIERRAEALGIRRSYYVYEANPVRELAMPRLFERLGLADAYHPRIFEGWAPRSAPASGISSDPEPPAYRGSGVVSEHPSFDYFKRDTSSIPEGARALLEERGIFALYRRHRARTAETLGLDPAAFAGEPGERDAEQDGPG